jgi:hypothetical protein
MPLSEKIPPGPVVIPLVKRSPREQEAYKHGFVIALRAAKEAIERSLANFTLTLEMMRKADRSRDN